MEKTLQAIKERLTALRSKLEELAKEAGKGEKAVSKKAAPRKKRAARKKA